MDKKNCANFATKKSYANRQAEWIKKHNVKVGDKVKVLRKCADYEDGWGETWVKDMEANIGKVNRIKTLCHSSLGISIEVPCNAFFYPYFVLEPVKEPEKCCTTCKYNFHKPAEKPGQSTTKRCLSDGLVGVWLMNEKDEYRKVTKAKENKMKTLNRIRKFARRLTMAWDLFGVFLLCRLANPFVTGFWLSRGDWTNSNASDKAVMPWVMTACVMIALFGALYGLHKFAAWYYGENK